MSSIEGFIQCNACKDLFQTNDYEQGFERWGHGEPVQLLNNPVSWGARNPKYWLLGFSKGATQNKALAEVRSGKVPINAVPFKGMRKRLGWLLKSLGIRTDDNEVDAIFADSGSDIQSASLIRCSISAKNAKGEYSYQLKDILAADVTSNGKVREIIDRCANKHLAQTTRNQAFILLGLDKDLIRWTKDTFTKMFGPITTITETTYRTKGISWLHVAHPSGNQTDPQYRRWCDGGTTVPKILWARQEISFRRAENDGER